MLHASVAKKNRMPKKYKTIIGSASLLLIGTLFLTHEHILLAIGNFLVIKKDLAPADIIHVIAGPDYRTDYAIKLYKQGYCKQIFFTGGWCHSHNLYHGQHSKESAVKQGIPLEAITTDDSEVTSTYSEAVRLKEFIAQSLVPIHSVIIVSDPFHMRRSRWTYQKVLGDKIMVQMAPVPFEFTEFKLIWWTDAKSRKYVKDEYLKTLYYHARYKFSWGKLREWLASLDKD